MNDRIELVESCIIFFEKFVALIDELDFTYDEDDRDYIYSEIKSLIDTTDSKCLTTSYTHEER